MSYSWSNNIKLDALCAHGSDGRIVFETQTEVAEVFFEENNIKRVVHKEKGVETIIESAEAKYLEVGHGNTKRYVHHYLMPGGPASELRIGITEHSSLGTWSSLPHDFELNLEEGFEEVFFYLLSGGKSRAIQLGEGLWCDGSRVNACWFVENNSFSTIPMGYHPVVGEPGVLVRYIWAYVCKKPEWEKI